MKRMIFCGFLLSVMACSSTPETRTSASIDEKQEYAAYAEKQLNNYQESIDDLKGYPKTELKASLQDARAELRGLNAASDSAWRTYKVRLDHDLDNLRSKYNRARAAE